MEEKIKRLHCDHCGELFEAPEIPGPQFCSSRCEKNNGILLAPPDRVDRFYHKITPEDFLNCRRSDPPFYVIAYSLTNIRLPFLVVAKFNDASLLFEYYDMESGVLHSFRQWPSNWIWQPAPRPDQALVAEGFHPGQIRPD